MNNPHFVITIGRQFGSGGREIGSLLAKKLQVEYYDKELLMHAAKTSGIRPEFFEKADEKVPSFLNNLFSFNLGYSAEPFFIGSTPITDDGIYKAQSDVMIDLANKSSCVIVGRSADYVLRHHPQCINVFIHSSLESRVERIIKRKDCDNEAVARTLAEKKNKLRANYYNFYTNKEWGDAQSYDITINSSQLSTEEVVDVILSYLRCRISNI